MKTAFLLFVIVVVVYVVFASIISFIGWDLSGFEVRDWGWNEVRTIILFSTLIIAAACAV